MPEPLPEPLTALLLARGVCRELQLLGYASLLEVALANGRRADIMALGGGGEIAIVEIKSSLADFRADRKWPDYWEFCDRLFFAVAADFPRDILPEECGLIVADPSARRCSRPSPVRKLEAARGGAPSPCASPASAPSACAARSIPAPARTHCSEGYLAPIFLDRRRRRVAGEQIGQHDPAAPASARGRRRPPRRAGNRRP